MKVYPAPRRRISAAEGFFFGIVFGLFLGFAVALAVVV
jgi:hypothetical protein